LVDTVNGGVIGKVETGREKAVEGEKGKLILPSRGKADDQNYQDTQLQSTPMGNVGLGPVDHQSWVYVKSAP